MELPMAGEYRFGIEEEYFLSDAATRDTCKKLPPHFVEECGAAFPEAFQPEFLEAQVEAATPPCTDPVEAEARLQSIRMGLSAIAQEHGLLVFAAGTHPLAVWSRQKRTDGLRYQRVMRDLQMIGNRNMVCGMHVHVETADEDRRVDIMTRMMPFIPLFLALSTSSPFWQARRTGLMGYRLAAYDELPRTGIPDLFEDQADYKRYIDIMVNARAIDDSSYVWWAIRPSLKYPTLELRVADSCTSSTHAVRLAMLFRCLVRLLERDPTVNAGLKPSSRAIAQENKWRAQRYGIHGSFVDEKKERLVSVHDVLEEAISLIEHDMNALGCREQILGLKDIFRDGTSADRQIGIYAEQITLGRNREAALGAVVDWLATASAGAARLH
jgi:glutamate---cysteine ligase / carboxylate-amine ligase